MLLKPWMLILAATSLLFVSEAVATNATDCCNAILRAVGKQNVLFPQPRDFGFFRFLYYFSQQEEQATPTCYVEAGNTKRLSKIMSIISAHNNPNVTCPFAIRGGGYTAWAGAANVPNGVTIDMITINGTTISSDKKIASIGAGSFWEDVLYDSVEAPLFTQNLTIPGSPIGRIGVGGTFLGGGLSILAPRTGFNCDSVINFEVVLASGKVVNANASSNADLFRALKGGSNNFGIVTRFDVLTVPFYRGWGGEIVYDTDTIPAQLRAFAQFAGDPNYDVYASNTLEINYSFGDLIVRNFPFYTKEVANATALHPFTSIPAAEFGPTYLNFMPIPDYDTDESNREFVLTTTFKPDVLLFDAAFELWNATYTQYFAPIAQPSESSDWGFLFYILFQALPSAALSHSSSGGGSGANDVLGLSASDGPLVVCVIRAEYFGAEHDAFVARRTKELVAAIETTAKLTGKYSAFKLLNYADVSQDVFGGYGAANKAFLQRTARKYDPDGVFQRGQPVKLKLFP